MISAAIGRIKDLFNKSERLKLAAFSAGANIASTLLNFAVFFISVPLTISYLGPEKFGIWMTVASIAGMLTFMDFGVGNGLVSRVANDNTPDRKRFLNRTISDGLVIMAFIGLLVGGVLSLLNYVFPIVNIINIEQQSLILEANQLLWLFIALFSMNVPLNGLYKILLGLQLNWIAHTIRSCVSIISLCALIYLASLEAEPVYLLFATYGFQVLGASIVIPILISRNYIRLDSFIDIDSLKSNYSAYFKVGGLFFVLQIGVMIGWGSDAFVISALSNVENVNQYVVLQRLFQFVSVPILIMNTPLWGSYADAHARGDSEFIRKTLRFAVLISFFISFFLSMSIYLGSEYIFDLWLDDSIAISGTLVLGFAVWKVLEAIGYSLSMALNGLHIIKIQVMSVIMLCGMVIPLKFYFIPEYGATAAVWATITAYFLSTMLFYAIMYHSVLRREFSYLLDKYTKK